MRYIKLKLKAIFILLLTLYTIFCLSMTQLILIGIMLGISTHFLGLKKSFSVITLVAIFALVVIAGDYIPLLRQQTIFWGWIL